MEKNNLLTANIDLIEDFFKGVVRQGPGSDEETRRALQFIPTLTANSRILDVGCGTGAQTMVLASDTPSHIIATDLLPEMIKGVEQKIEAIGYGSRVKGLIASMDALPFESNEFDLIWAEGSVFIVGFENGLALWRKFLKQNGYIAVTEISWFTDKRPNEIDNYWKNNYPAISSISENIKVMESVGYMPVASFALPETCWIDNFYLSVAERIKEFSKIYAGNDKVMQFLEQQKVEMEMYSRYKEYFGYVFYIGKKVE